jgi:hypothetical protein
VLAFTKKGTGTPGRERFMEPHVKTGMITMRKSRELLLRLYHDPRCQFSEVVVWYIDRGAPQDQSCVEGPGILALDAPYMELSGPYGPTPIPYRRITRILYKGRTVWQR